MEPKQIAKQMIDFNKKAFDSSFEAMAVIQEQTEKMVVSLMEQLTAENASVAMDQESYKSRFERLSERYIKGNDQVATLDATIRNRQYRKAKTELFIKELRKLDEMVTAFSDELWYSLIDHATVYGKTDVRFTFKNGIELGE